MYELHNKTTVFNGNMRIVKDINQHCCPLQFCIILFRWNLRCICVRTGNTMDNRTTDISLWILNRTTIFTAVKTVFTNLVMREGYRYIPFYCTRTRSSGT